MLNKRIRISVVALGILAIITIGLYLTSNHIISYASILAIGKKESIENRTPGEIIRYLKRRLEGHPKLETVALPLIHYYQRRVERPVNTGEILNLGKGQQNFALLHQQYTSNGQPIESLTDQDIQPHKVTGGNTIYASSVEEILSKTTSAKSGQTIIIMPGRYFLNERINTNSAGTKDLPIIIKSNQPGTVFLDFNTEVAFRVSQPFWIFENLNIRGRCKRHLDCEHAFHIYGRAGSTVVRNNHIEDFNAHIKINGTIGSTNSDWPDNGLIQYNTITNSTRRETHVPITPIDVVGANNWHIKDNLITNFIKGDGNLVSYGMFMKGAGTGGRIERNLVVCTPKDISQPGVRVGISFGGGTTDKRYCRDSECTFEHSKGIVANNIVAHCNDFGIDVNNSKDILIAYNILVNTAGIDARQTSSNVKVFGNIFEGLARTRGGADMRLEFNENVEISGFFEDPDALLLEWRKLPEKIPSISSVLLDFCGRKRRESTFPGAFSDKELCKI